MEIKLTITPTEDHDFFGDPVYDIEINDNGHLGAGEGSHSQLNTVITSNLKATLARLNTGQCDKLTITFTLEERQEQ